MCVVNRFCRFVTLSMFAVLAAVLLAGHLSVAQTQPAAASPTATSPEINAELEKIVHPKKAKVGDQVVARMTAPCKLTDGTELPKGTRILGKVTDVKMKADKEGPSKLGLLFTTAQLKGGKEIPVTMALVSVAPHWEQGSVDPVAAENGAASAGRVDQMSSAEGRSEGSAGGDTLSKGLGIRGSSSVGPSAMRPGVSYLPDMTIASYSMGEPGTVLQSTKTTVYLDAGTRLLLLAQ